MAFQCNLCEESFDSNDFVSFKGDYYCAWCFKNKLELKCEECGESVLAASLSKDLTDRWICTDGCGPMTDEEIKARERAKARWMSAKSLLEVSQCGAEYLRGQLTWSPYPRSDYYPNTPEDREITAKICEMGLLVTRSQAGGPHRRNYLTAITNETTGELLSQWIARDGFQCELYSMTGGTKDDPTLVARKHHFEVSQGLLVVDRDSYPQKDCVWSLYWLFAFDSIWGRKHDLFESVMRALPELDTAIS